MNATPPKSHLVNPDTEADRDEADNCKDVFFPDDPTGEIFLRVHTTWVFEAAGYRVRQASKAETHPVFVVHLTRTTAERISDDVKLLQHLWKILNAHGISLAKADLVLSRSGDRINLSFLMVEYPFKGK